MPQGQKQNKTKHKIEAICNKLNKDFKNCTHQKKISKKKAWCSEKSVLTEREDRKSCPGQMLWTEMCPLSTKSDIEVPAPNLRMSQYLGIRP